MKAKKEAQRRIDNAYNRLRDHRAKDHERFHRLLREKAGVEEETEEKNEEE
ncbi:MAG: hypothetical protein GF414_08560 [Candidatus Altiarchaeales archaeon]|nr:hypothetical protein [Candidatus Altiarchaeales archaeon]